MVPLPCLSIFGYTILDTKAIFVITYIIEIIFTCKFNMFIILFVSYERCYPCEQKHLFSNSVTFTANYSRVMTKQTNLLAFQKKKPNNLFFTSVEHVLCNLRSQFIY